MTADAPADALTAALARMRGDGLGYVPPIPADGKLRDKVCIVGFAGSTRDQFPKGDPSFEVWGMNRLHEVPGINVANFTRWMQIHPRRIWDTEKRAKEVAWMKRAPIPVYMNERHDDIPASIEYPRAAVEAAFNRYLPTLPGSGKIRNDELPYHTTTVTWLIALALLEGFKEIHIYGVDMVCDEEYGYQRPGCEFWLGLAAGLGVKTVIPEDSALCTLDWLYGYEMPDDLEGTINTPLLKNRLHGLTSERDKAVAAVNQMIGAINEIQNELNALKHRKRGGKTFQKASAALGPQPQSKPSQVSVAADEPALRCGVKG